LKNIIKPEGQASKERDGWLLFNPTCWPIKNLVIEAPFGSQDIQTSSSGVSLHYGIKKLI
jgi:hypothetical protein